MPKYIAAFFRFHEKDPETDPAPLDFVSRPASLIR